MKTIYIEQQTTLESSVFDVAQQEPVLLFMPDGREFILTQADNFEAEVDALRNSLSFQNFLEERSKCQVRIPIEEIEREIDEELKISSSA
ncbi:MAG: hypothetical protein DRR19_13835 [Candidatus Parabeggiatoa sp. nov. 1]|nr:MAG: hypothetical protein DRR19_13835 [Gammaproteobacteria bacterium]